jgi:hypothetical protein
LSYRTPSVDGAALDPVDIDTWTTGTEDVEEGVGVYPRALSGDAAGGTGGLWEECLAVAVQVAADVVGDVQFGFGPFRIRPPVVLGDDLFGDGGGEGDSAADGAGAVGVSPRSW